MRVESVLRARERITSHFRTHLTGIFARSSIEKTLSVADYVRIFSQSEPANLPASWVRKCEVILSRALIFYSSNWRVNQEECQYVC